MGGEINRFRGGPQGVQPGHQGPETAEPSGQEVKSGMRRVRRNPVKAAFRFLTSGLKNLFFRSSGSAQLKGLARKVRATTSKPAVFRFSLRYDRKTFDKNMVWKQFPLKGARRFSRILKKSEQLMQYRGGMDNVLSACLMLRRELAGFRKEVEKTDSMVIQWQEAKNRYEQVLEEGPEGPPEDAEDLKKVRLDVLSDLELKIEESFNFLGPQGLIKALDELKEQRNAGMTLSDYQRQYTKLDGKLKEKEKMLTGLRNCKTDTVRMLVNSWLRELDAWYYNTNNSHSRHAGSSALRRTPGPVRRMR